MSRTTRLLAAGSVFLATLSCSAGSEPTTSTTATTTASTALPVAPAIVDVIELNGSEALGLTITDDAVWAITYQTGTLSRIDPGSGDVTLSEEIGSQIATLLTIRR